MFGVVVQAAAVFFQHYLQLLLVKTATVGQRQNLTRPLMQRSLDPFADGQCRHGLGTEHKVVIEVIFCSLLQEMFADAVTKFRGNGQACKHFAHAVIQERCTPFNGPAGAHAVTLHRVVARHQGVQLIGSHLLCGFQVTVRFDDVHELVQRTLGVREEGRTHHALAVFFGAVADQVEVIAHREIGARHLREELLVVAETEHDLVGAVTREHHDLALLVCFTRKQEKQEKRKIAVRLLGMPHHGSGDLGNVSRLDVQRLQVDVEVAGDALCVRIFRKTLVFDAQADRVNLRTIPLRRQPVGDDRRINPARQEEPAIDIKTHLEFDRFIKRFFKVFLARINARTIEWPAPVTHRLGKLACAITHEGTGRQVAYAFKAGFGWWAVIEREDIAQGRFIDLALEFRQGQDGLHLAGKCQAALILGIKAGFDALAVARQHAGFSALVPDEKRKHADQVVQHLLAFFTPQVHQHLGVAA